MSIRRIPRRAGMLGLIAVTAAGALLAVRPGLASDHQDTPEVELNPRMDINDVYAFPGATSGRITLVVTTSSPIAPGSATTARFDPNLLYQIKVDNTGDAIEDLVFQATFVGTGADQQIVLRGPVAPSQTGTMSTLVTTGPEVTGTINTVLGSASGTQVFAGIRQDPFFIDLEQFFRIIPDRRPATGPLSAEPTPASSWRNPGVDLLNGLSTLAIVIELPVAQLTTATNKKIGVWATISR